MKIHKITFYALALLSFVSCQQDDIVPDTPDVPAEGYHLTFDGGVGVETGTRAVWNDDSGLGNLIFQWDYTEDTGTNEMVMAFMNGGQLLASNNGEYHTYATIKPHSQHSGDVHWAVFETLEKYEHDMPSGQYDGYKVLAVTPYHVEDSSTDEGNMYASGTLSISDNTWDLGDSPTTTELTMTDYELLVIPMECESFPITITMKSGRTFKATISLSGVGNKLEAGTQYKIILQVGQDKVTLDGITASSWEEYVGGELATE